jgi:hypothetical protein
LHPLSLTDAPPEGLSVFTALRPFRSIRTSSYFPPQAGTNPVADQFFSHHSGGEIMKKYLLAAAMVGAIATPALADDVGVRVGPVGAGVTVGEDHHDRDRTTVIKKEERPPADRTTVIKKEDSDGNRSKTVIHHDD